MLEQLRQIVQMVVGAPELASALNTVVSEVKRTLNADACTIYLVDHQRGDYVLMATEGLNDAAMRHLRVPFGQGLVGFVAEKEEPINLENAHKHPNFFPIENSGEDAFQAFMGVPILHQRRVIGVLVIQQQQTRRYDKEEEAFLITLSAQLAGVIAHAEATGALTKYLTQLAIAADEYISDEGETHTLEGIPSAPGVAFGTSIVVFPPADLEAVPVREVEDTAAEVDYFMTVLAATREEVTRMANELSQALSEDEGALFDVYLKILDDNSLGKQVRAEIEKGQWAQSALCQVIKNHIRAFEAMSDPYLRERASDIRDLGRRLLANLQKNVQAPVDYPEQTILMGEDITPSDLASVPAGRLAGVVSSRGSNNSHIAILARAMGVPTVMGADGAGDSQFHLTEIIVDGYYGLAYVAPTAPLKKEFLGLIEEEKQLDANLATLRNLPAETPDGHKVTMAVNTGLSVDAGLSIGVGAESVGLYRTEIPFMTRDRFPTEEEQRVIYQQVLTAFAPRPVVMRTLDIGGDKALPYFSITEANPFLGWRGIRVTLDHPEVFLMQVRAMLQASSELYNLKIMLPMVSHVDELDEAIALIGRAYQEVCEEGWDVVKPQVGVMIEVPSAVYQVRDFAKRVDFLSVGSNDLIQYLLAVDRNNARVADLYQGLHPSVLRALKEIVTSAHELGRTVSICGEMASDPLAVIVLLGMGYDCLSMSASSLLRAKWVVRNFTLVSAKKLLKDVLAMDSHHQVQRHLETALCEAGLGGLIRAGFK